MFHLRLLAVQGLSALPFLFASLTSKDRMNHHLFAKTAIAAATLSLAFSASAASLVENFDVAPPTGWTIVNNSTPVGTTNWFQGNPTVFTAQAGAANSYMGANFNAVGGANTISNWIVLPTLSFDNGDVVSFWTRTVDANAFPDRLELRFSNVGGTNVGTSPTSVGTFTNLLLSVNPSLAAGGYPEDWTQFSTTISGLSGSTNGALAFRYFVEDGGPFGDNSNFIGIDTFSITAVPEPGTWLLMGLGLGALALRRLKSV